MLYSEEEEDLVRSLHQAYVSRKLHIVIGSQLSTEAGLPSSRALFDRFISERIESALANRNPDLALFPDDSLSALAAECQRLWGASALDILQSVLPAEDALRDQLASILYGDIGLDQLQAPSLHKQLVVMRQARLLTTCLDPLLERAAEQLRLTKAASILHLCGVLPPPSDPASPTALDPHAPATPAPMLLEQLLEADASPRPSALAKTLQSHFRTSIVLVIGFAADDECLRWLLRFHKESKDQHLCVAILVRPETSAARWAANQLLQSCGVAALWVDGLQESEPVLRDISFGLPLPEECPAWVTQAIQWRSHRDRLSDHFLFEGNWQSIAVVTLEKLVDQLQLLFNPAHNETVECIFLLPLQLHPALPPTLSIVANSSPPPRGTSPRERAERFSLSLKRGREQGVSGLAFSSGLIISSADELSEEGPEFNFDQAMRDRWYQDSFRQWRSILSVPVLDSHDWLPVCVLAITSSAANPFWDNLSLRHRNELLMSIRSTAKVLLTGARELSAPIKEKQGFEDFDPQAARFARTVRENFFEPVRLANYSGYLCAESSSGWSLQVGEPLSLTVSLRHAPPAGVLSEQVEVIDGSVEPSVEFDIELLSEEFDFVPYAAKLAATPGGDSPATTFTCTKTSEPPGKYMVYVQLYQRNRFVQVLPCEVSLA